MPRAKQFDEEEVLKKAMVLFWKKGYHNTSIKDLIDFLGISNASIYNTFGGKKQLFDRAFAHYRTSNFEAMSQFLSTQEDVRQGLRMVFQKIIHDDHSDKDCKGCLIANSTTELLPADTMLQEVITLHQKNTEKVFHDYLKTGVKKGQISKEKNIKVISNLLYTLMTGLRVVGKTKPNPKESMASVDAVLSLLD